jgi:glycosyltransferase involved in cell wall biosynthesis
MENAQGMPNFATVESNRRSGSSPFFSICIPQYNRTAFLLKCLKSISEQTFKDYEVCISDGGSTDGGEQRIYEFLRSAGMGFRYEGSDTNLKYDENLRRAISLSSGHYVFLMGNDDALADSSVLANVASRLQEAPNAVAAVTNYRELGSGAVYARISQDGVLGSGPKCAASTFRLYAFVSGVIFHGPMAREAACTSVDGSEMYQMYLGTHLVSSGGSFLGLRQVCIHKDIQIPDEQVDSYRTRVKEPGWPVRQRPLPLGRLIHTVWTGAVNGAGENAASRIAASVANQLYEFTYPYWMIEYRRAQSLGYALGVYLALRPNETCKHIPISMSNKGCLWILYLLCGLCAAIVPLHAFDRLRSRLYQLAKRSRGLSSAAARV